MRTLGKNLALTERLTPIGIPIDKLTGNADALDASLASLSARAASLGKTHLLPDSETAESAVREGWIHIPTTLELCTPHPPDSQ